MNVSRRELFRQEAVQFQFSNRRTGKVALLQPVSTKLLSWLLFGSIIAVLAFACSAQYTRKETVAGYLRPTAGTAKIFVPQRGVVKDLHVADGDEVEEGQPLLTISTEQITRNGQDVNSTILSTLELQRDLTRKQLESENERGRSESERLRALISGLETELSRMREQADLQSQRLKLSESFVAAGNQLAAKGVVADLELKHRQETALEQRQNLALLHQQIADRNNQLTEAQYNLEQLPTNTGAKLQSLRDALATVEQRIAETTGKQAYVIRAPMAGRVTTVQASVGEAADPSQLQMEIIPQDAKLEAALFFPTRAFGFVHPGQEVRILYDAFPYQKFGAFQGRVVSVSHTIVSGNETSGPLAVKEPMYRVTAALDRQDVEAHGQKIVLQPDMSLKADVLLEKRSLMSWLLGPLLSTRM
jgi:membrane fusion protein